MLLVDEGCLQPDLVGADRIVPVASVAASRDLDASSSTQRAATQIAAATRREAGQIRGRDSNLFWLREAASQEECRSYSGLSPSASNCRLHSGGGSRSR